MDAETIRMIVPAATGVVGALLGSGLTGFLTAKNAKASREAERELLELRTEQEQEKSRREEKQELFARCLGALDRLTQHVSRANFSDTPLDEEAIRHERFLITEASYVMNLYPDLDGVGAAYQKVVSAQTAFLSAVEDSLNTTGHGLPVSELNVSSQPMFDATAVLIVCMRLSLANKLKTGDV